MIGSLFKGCHIIPWGPLGVVECPLVTSGCETPGVKGQTQVFQGKKQALDYELASTEIMKPWKHVFTLFLVWHSQV